MSFEFDEAYYLKSKLAQLKASDTQYTDWTTDQVKQAILDAGMTVEEHYKQYSLIEGTSANPYFNTVEYLEAKVKQLNSTHEGGKTDWTVADVVKAFQDAGFTSAEDHYDMYGCHEMDATGKLINPSNAFDANAYVEAKLAQLQQTDPENWEGKTAADVLDAIVAAGMTPIEHFEEYGKAEGAAADPAIDMVQTVPVVERVGNDQLRDAMDENVPSNYNAATPAPKNVTEGTSVAKPCDMGDEDAVKPSDPVATPADVDYVPVPGNGITDTNENPVQLVTADVKDASGSEVKVSQYGIASTEGNVTTVQPVGTDGKPVAGADPIQTVTKDGDTTTTETSVKSGSNAISEKSVDNGSGTVTTETTASLNGGATTVEQTETATTNPSTGYTTTKTEGEVKNANGKVVAQTESTETTSPAGNSSTTTDKVTTLDPATGKVTGSTESTTTSQTAADGTVTNTTNGTTKDANGNVTGTFQTTETVAKDENGTVTTQADTTKKDAAGAVTETSSTTTTQDRAADGTLTTAVSGTSTDADGNVTTTNEVTAAKTNPVTGTTTESKTVDNETKDADGNVTASESGTVQTTVQADGSATKTTDMTTTDADGNTTKTETTSTYDADTGKTTTKGTETTTDAGGNTKTETVNATATGDAAGNANTPSEQAAADADSGNSESGNTPSGGGDSGGGSASVSLKLSDITDNAAALTMEGSAASDAFTLDSYNAASQATTLTATGLAGDDAFTVSGDVSDRASNKVTVTLNGGEGKDIFTVSADQTKGIAINGDAGDDTFTFSADQTGDAALDGGAGNDTFKFSKALTASSTVTGGDGNDTFTVSGNLGAAVTLGGGAGDDTFTVSEAQNGALTLNGEAGADSFEISAVLAANSKLDGGDGNDTFTISATQTNAVEITTGDGDNTVEFASALAGTTALNLTGGSGTKDIIKVSAKQDDVVNLSGSAVTDFNTLDMVDGKVNSVTLSVAQAGPFLNGNVKGEYNDLVTITGGAFKGTINDLPVSVQLADVSDNQITINAMNGAKITGAASQSDTFILGAGFKADASTGKATLDGGADKTDVLQLGASNLDLSAVTVTNFETLDLNNNAAVIVKADLIAGDDAVTTIRNPGTGAVITLSGAAKGELAHTTATIQLADEVNTVTANATGSTISLGAKADTVTLGNGNDTVKLVAETEADTITELNVANDKLDVSAITALDGGAFSVVTKSGDTYALKDTYVHTLVDANAASLEGSAFTLEEGKTALVAAHTAADATTYNMYLVTGGATPTVASLGTVTTTDAALTADVFGRTEDKSGGTLAFDVTNGTLSFTTLGDATEFAIKVAGTSKVTVNNSEPTNAAVTTIDLNGFTTQTVTIASADATTAGLYGNADPATSLEISNGTATTTVNLTANKQDTLKINGDSAVVTVSGGLSDNDAVSGSFKLYNSTTTTGNADLTVTTGAIVYDETNTILSVSSDNKATLVGSLNAVKASATKLEVTTGTVDLHGDKESSVDPVDVTGLDDGLTVAAGAKLQVTAAQLATLSKAGITAADDTAEIDVMDEMSSTYKLGIVTNAFKGTLKASEDNAELFVAAGADISEATLDSFRELNITGVGTTGVTISNGQFDELTQADQTSGNDTLTYGIKAAATDKLTVTGDDPINAADISEFKGILTVNTALDVTLASGTEAATIASVTGAAVTKLTLDATNADLTVTEFTGKTAGTALTVAGTNAVKLTESTTGKLTSITGGNDAENVTVTFAAGQDDAVTVSMGKGADAVNITGGGDNATVTYNIANGDSTIGAPENEVFVKGYDSITGFTVDAAHNDTLAFTAASAYTGTGGVKGNEGSTITVTFNNGIASFDGEGATGADVATLAQAVAYARNANHENTNRAAGQTVAFVKDGNTYVVNFSTADASETLLDNDSVVELVGVTGVNEVGGTAGATTLVVDSMTI